MKLAVSWAHLSAYEQRKPTSHDKIPCKVIHESESQMKRYLPHCIDKICKWPSECFSYYWPGLLFSECTQVICLPLYDKMCLHEIWFWLLSIGVVSFSRCLHSYFWSAGQGSRNKGDWYRCPKHLRTRTWSSNYWTAGKWAAASAGCSWSNEGNQGASTWKEGDFGDIDYCCLKHVPVFSSICYLTGKRVSSRSEFRLTHCDTNSQRSWTWSSPFCNALKSTQQVQCHLGFQQFSCVQDILVLGQVSRLI